MEVMLARHVCAAHTPNSSDAICTQMPGQLAGYLKPTKWRPISGSQAQKAFGFTLPEVVSARLSQQYKFGKLFFHVTPILVLGRLASNTYNKK
jgi:hypothetical protein